MSIEHWRRRLRFGWRYLRGHTGWDSGITPPEVVAYVAEQAPGRALDIGCGTGTNVIYLAQQGWQAVGFDYIPQPIRQAQRKARAAGVQDQTRFLVGDVIRLGQLALGTEPYDLALDIGCSHGLSAAARADYARDLAQRLAPGAALLLYALASAPGRSMGMTEADVRADFPPYFDLMDVQTGADAVAGTSSAWYFLRRATDSDQGQ